MKQKNPRYDNAKSAYESANSRYQQLASQLGTTHPETVKALNEQSDLYWKWKAIPEYIEVKEDE
jgi:hypothetical protein